MLGTGRLRSRPESLLLISIILLSASSLLGNLAGEISENYSFIPPIGGPPPPPGPVQRWMNLTSTLSVSPGDRSLTSMVYDEADGYQILFGGWNGSQVLGDTWTFQSGVWKNITSTLTTSPPPRMGAGIAYDTVDRYVVLFGGSTLPGGQGTVYGDTWVFETGSWRLISTPKSPTPRSDSPMSYDPIDGYAVLFGGSNHGNYLGDTWRFNGGVWASINATESPSARALVGMTYDPLDKYVLLYGGVGNSTGSVTDSNETWSFVGGIWRHLITPVSPGGRDSFGMGYYPSVKSVLIYGGRNGACGPDLGDTWGFQLGAWMQASTLSSPPPGQGMTLSFNPATGTILLFGGETDQTVNHTSPCPSANLKMGFWDFTSFLQVLSPNWAGYAVTGANNSITDVRGSWIVPSVVGTCPPGDAIAGFWVGIDGFNSTTVEQTGTASGCRNGHPIYFAWFEFFPLSFHRIGFMNIQPGDVISAEVRYDGSFVVSLSDITGGRTFLKSVTGISAQRSSAEWIVEAPSSKGGILPLADFGTVGLGLDETGVADTCFVTMNGAEGSIGLFSPIQEMSMISPSRALKTAPTDLSSDGTSFSADWNSAGP